jgi:hypothetical protein
MPGVFSCVLSQTSANLLPALLNLLMHTFSNGILRTSSISTAAQT